MHDKLLSENVILNQIHIWEKIKCKKKILHTVGRCTT